MCRFVVACTAGVIPFSCDLNVWRTDAVWNGVIISDDPFCRLSKSGRRRTS